MVQLNEREWVIGLHDYLGVSLPQELFAAFDGLVMDELAQVGLELTYVAIEGNGYTGKATKANGAAYRRLKEAHFAGITCLDFSCNPTGSDEPAYDRFFNASLNVTPHNDNLLTFCLNDGILAFGSHGFRRILQRVANLHDWTTGYAFVDLSSKQPEFHVMGLDDGNLAAEEYDRLVRWYTSRREDKVTRIRSIYPFNLLNSTQLQQRLPNGQTVGEFAASHHCSELVTEGFGHLTLWALPERELSAVRAVFDGCDAVIA